MSRRISLSALVIAVALLASACSGDDSSVVEQVAVVAATADGGQIDFGSLEGSDSLLWFWAPW